MLLFPQKDDKSAVKEKVFFVCSVRESVSTRLSEMIRMAGFSHVENIAQDLLQNSQISFLANASGVIIDIGHSVDPQEVIAKVQATIPRNVWCCVVGDSDSIALAQSFSRQGIFYFNVNVQAEELIVAATTGMSASSPRGTACVSVLGCKGGVGNTQIAWQLAQQIVQRRSMPTLFIQGIEDLQSLLERRLDIVFPYQKSRSFAAFTIRKQVAPIDLLAQRVLGASTQTTSKFMRRLSHKPER